MFVDEWAPSPVVAIVKPIQSAGSDDVFKCLNEVCFAPPLPRVAGFPTAPPVYPRHILIISRAPSQSLSPKPPPQSKAEVKVAFDKINGQINSLGVVNEGVLVQEFLGGVEYVIDSVNRDGVHKIVRFGLMNDAGS